MKPVAWYIENNYYESLEEAQFFCDNKAQIAECVTPLYTAGQLREAQVKVLREAAEMIRCKRNVGDVFRAEAELIRVADELEKK